jgi:hypothetical protein
MTSECEKFANSSVLHGDVPPHPGDVSRAIKSALQAPKIVAEAISVSVPSDSGPRQYRRSDEILIPTAEVPVFTEEEHKQVLAMASRTGNPLAQRALEKLHEQIPRVTVKDLRNFVRTLIGNGEIHIE